MTAVFAGTVCSVGYTRIKQISMGKKIHNNINGAGGRKSRLYVSWVVTIVIAFLIVIPVRRFCIESYRISTSAMEDALHQGDYILVNKLPLEGNPGRNKVVLFTSPLLKDTVSNPLLLSRCIGMPGDTILVSGDGYEVNGKLLPHSPRALNTCFITQKSAADFLKALQKLSIPVRNWKSETFGFSFSLTSFEEYQLREELTEEMNIHFIRNQSAPYKLVVPRKGRAYRLDEAALVACKEAILAEAGEKAVFRWRCASGSHPFPSRTRWLRLTRPTILGWRRPGKIGGCRIYGGLAQLGERLPCKQEVTSSNLVFSTRMRDHPN